jgi:glycerate kinase
MTKASVLKFFPDCEVISLPVADGGEGTVDCFLTALQGKKVYVKVHGPHMESTTAYYGRFGSTAIIEMAQAAGLPMVGDRRDPAVTTTYGVGELMAHAVQNGATELIVGLGGSATNDGGCGCAAALGVLFLDRNGKEFIPTGGTLEKIASIDITKAQQLLSGCRITAMCDIDNPMHGPTGAAYIFGPQKGANDEMVQELDQQLVYLDQKIQQCLGKNVADIAGAGAAGAFGAGMMAFFDASLNSGIEIVLDTVHFNQILAGADAVFTGEGKIDGQSLQGKVVIGVAKRAKRQHVPVYVLAGDVADDAYSAYDLGVSAIFSINRFAIPFSQAKLRSGKDYAHTLEDVLRLIKSVSKS